MNTARLRRSAAQVAALALLGTLAACGGEDPESDGDSLTVWIQEDLPDRVAATQKIVDDFEAESGVQVKLVSRTSSTSCSPPRRRRETCPT
jgi:multiple sugar transport system substrate-binding protein